MPSSTALQLLRAFTFQPGGRISIGYSPWKTTVLVLTRHFRAVYSGVQAPGRKRAPWERPWTRILQEGHRMASRPNLAGVDTRDGIDVLFHFACRRLTLCIRRQVCADSLAAARSLTCAATAVFRADPAPCDKSDTSVRQCAGWPRSLCSATNALDLRLHLSIQRSKNDALDTIRNSAGFVGFGNGNLLYAGGLIHVLLAVAVVVLVIRLFQGRRVLD